MFKAGEIGKATTSCAPQNQASPLRSSLQLRQRDEVRIGQRFTDHNAPIRLHHSRQFAQCGIATPDLANHADEIRSIE